MHMTSWLYQTYEQTFRVNTSNCLNETLVTICFLFYDGLKEVNVNFALQSFLKHNVLTAD